MTNSKACLFPRSVADPIETSALVLLGGESGSPCVDAYIAANDAQLPKGDRLRPTTCGTSADPLQLARQSRHQPLQDEPSRTTSARKKTRSKALSQNDAIEQESVLLNAGNSTTKVRDSKTLYKLSDESTGLFCQGGPWPCQWDEMGRTWSSIAALRRHLRTMLSRGYHLKPRAAPEHWKVLEIKQITIETQSVAHSAGTLMCV